MLVMVASLRGTPTAWGAALSQIDGNLSITLGSVMTMNANASAATNQSVAIVTGASQGIGQATAIRLARDFSALALIARNRPNLERTAEAVRAAGARTLIIDADLAQPAAAKAVIDQTLTAFGRIDALLNIAGAVPQIDLF